MIYDVDITMAFECDYGSPLAHAQSKVFGIEPNGTEATMIMALLKKIGSFNPTEECTNLQK